MIDSTVRNKLLQIIVRFIVLIIDASYLIIFISSFFEGDYIIALISGLVCIALGVAARKIEEHQFKVLFFNVFTSVLGLILIAYLGERAG